MPQKDTIMTQSYLDFNATTPLRPAARAALISAYDCGPLNASSIHTFGRTGRKIIEHARMEISKFLGTDNTQIIFNSGATEGNNTVLHHFETTYPDDIILVSAIEHPSIIQATKHAEYIPVTSDGNIDLNALEARLKQTPRVSLVSVMFANNETGAIQDIKSAAELAHRYCAFFHTDATQAAGRLQICMRTSGIDFLTASSHKIGGPQGVGVLALGNCGQTPTLLLGGGQEKSARAGTENIAGIAGFSAAASECLNPDVLNLLQTLRKKTEDGILSIAPNAIIHAATAKRLVNTTLFSIPEKDSQSLLMAFDLEGIAISNGSACSSGSVKPSHVLKAMGADEKLAASALRISTGWSTTESDIDAFLNAWERIYKRISKK